VTEFSAPTPQETGPARNLDARHDHYDATDSAASYTSTCRSHDVTAYPAPTGCIWTRI
jgi:hypothetical protein